MKGFFTVFTLVVLLAGGAWADAIDLSGTKTANGLEIVSQSADSQGNLSLSMSWSLAKLYFYDANTPKGAFTVMYAPEACFGGNYGAPQLPVITKLVQIPFGSKYEIVVKDYDEKEYDLAEHGISTKIFPRQPSAPKDGSEVPFIYEKSAYVTKGFNGLPLTTIKEIGIMRHMRLVQVTIAPVKYDPVANKIVVYNNIEFDIALTGADMPTTKAAHAAHFSSAFSFLNQVVLVPEALKFPTQEAAQGYLIVTDPAFKDAIAPFAAWKTQKGFKVQVVTTEQFGTGAAISEPLKNYIHDLYNNPTAAMPSPSYVLFVGDHEQIPAFKGQSGSHITELPYVAVTAGDNLPDILTGRFSAQNLDQLKPQIEKTMEYEKKQMPDPAFLDNTVLIAGWDGSWARSHGWPHINYATKYYFNADHGFKNVYAYLSAGSSQNVSAIQSNIAKGVGYVNYTAHGSPTSWADPGMSISDIQRLGNKGKYPFVVGNCCLTSKFEVSTCFGEAWLRQKDGGAIGYIGGTNSTYWDEDIWWGIGVHAIVKPNDQGVPPLEENTGRGAIDSLFEGNGISNAGFMVVGNLAVESSASSRKLYYWEVYHLMGDPSLKTFMGSPKTPR